MNLRIPDIHEGQNTPVLYISFDNSINTPPFKNLRDIDLKFHLFFPKLGKKMAAATVTKDHP